MKSIYILLILLVSLIHISCDDDNYSFFYSTDPGLEWELRNIGFVKNLNDIAYSGQTYITVGDSTIFLSHDAITWDIAYANAPGDVFRALWTGEQFVVVGENCILSSSDGANWQLTEVEGSIHDLTCLDGLIVAVGDSGRSLASNDGLVWKAGNHGFAAYAVTSVQSDYPDFIVGGPWLHFRYAEDGINWDYDSPYYTNSYNYNYIRSMVVYPLPIYTDLSKQIVAVGDSGLTYGLQYNYNQAMVDYNNLNKVVKGHDRILIVGDDGTILLSSKNTNTVTLVPTLTTLDLNGAVATDLGFVAVGDSGIIISSPINKTN